MRYEEYLKQAERLEKQIAECLSREVKTANGSGPWFVKLFPGLRRTTINVANRKRGMFALQRAALEREVFADPSTVFNANANLVFRRTVPNSPEAVNNLRAVADAAYDANR
jgi:hypothetical protein